MLIVVKSLAAANKFMILDSCAFTGVYSNDSKRGDRK